VAVRAYDRQSPNLCIKAAGNGTLRRISRKQSIFPQAEFWAHANNLC
jgi:hypothetical protein